MPESLASEGHVRDLPKPDRISPAAVGRSIGLHRLLALLGFACRGVLVTACIPPAAAQDAASQPGASRPSIVLILTDDEDLAAHDAHMPQTKALLEERGTRFDDHFVTYSFCAPSRVTLLRGQ